MKVVSVSAESDWHRQHAVPVIVQGCTESWRAMTRWASIDALVEHYGSVEFDLATDVRLTLREYLLYAESNTVDIPYYLVERKWESPGSWHLLDDFCVPAPFADDLFSLIEGAAAPRYWFVGGPRSGSYLHVDPLLTEAWNACTCGAKRWVFLPPDTDLAALGLETFQESQRYRQSAASWFADEYPKLAAAAAEGRVTLFECVQRAGDCVYTPPGWYHAVLNCELSVAISQNLHHPRMLPATWPRLLQLHAPFALSLREVLSVARPEVAAELPVPGPWSEGYRSQSEGSQSEGSQSEGSQSEGSQSEGSQSEGSQLAPGRDGGGVPSTHAVHWQSCNAATGAVARATKPLLFVHASWLREALASADAAHSMLRQGGRRGASEEAWRLLTAYHGRFHELACAVAEDNAALCLVADKEGVPSQRVEHELRLHRLPALAATVPPCTDLQAFAESRNAPRWAQLSVRVTPEHVTKAMCELATPSGPAAIVTPHFAEPQQGCNSASLASTTKLLALRRCVAGDRILGVPLSACLLIDGHGDSLAALERLLSQEHEQQPADLGACLSYFRAQAPLERFKATMVQWWAGGADPRITAAAQQSMGGTVAWQRAEAWQAQARAEHEAMRGRTGVDTDYDTFVSAKLLLSACSRRVAGRKAYVLCPLVDLAAHSSCGATAEVVMTEDEVQLRALYTLDPGDEVSICFDSDAEFSDCFERFGFFDASSVVHTAEVRVPPLELLVRNPASEGVGAADEPWRAQLVAAAKADGCDESLEAWWLPDHRFEVCPLLRAIRAGLVSAAEGPGYPPAEGPGYSPTEGPGYPPAEGPGYPPCGGRAASSLSGEADVADAETEAARHAWQEAWMETLSNPICSEAAARAKLADLISKHLVCSPEKVQHGPASSDDATEGGGGTQMGGQVHGQVQTLCERAGEAALRFARFEHRLLTTILNALRPEHETLRASGGSQHASCSAGG